MEPSNNVAGLVIWYHILLTGLSLTTLLFLLLFIQEMRWGRSLMIESNWGGIGGDSGGWRMSSSLAFLLGLLATATLLVIVFIHVENSREPIKPPGDTPATEKKASAPNATPTANAAVTAAPAAAADSTAAATPAPSKGPLPTPQQPRLRSSATGHPSPFETRETSMPITIIERPEVLTEAALTSSDPPLLIRSSAVGLLIHELRRYCKREVSGRSFLIAGHRGSGKTTLVLNACQEIFKESDDERFPLRPLLVMLQGPQPSPER